MAIEIERIVCLMDEEVAAECKDVIAAAADREGEITEEHVREAYDREPRMFCWECIGLGAWALIQGDPKQARQWAMR